MKATKEKVFTAADAILEDDSTPSAISVRKAIGGGSYETIQNHLEEWRELQAVKAAASAEPMPAPAAEVVRLFGSQLWQRARDGANDRLAAERKAMDAERTELEASRRETMQMADQLASELDQVREERATLERSVSMAQADIESLRQQLAAAHAGLPAMKSDTGPCSASSKRLGTRRDWQGIRLARSVGGLRHSRPRTPIFLPGCRRYPVEGAAPESRGDSCPLGTVSWIKTTCERRQSWADVDQ